MRCHIPKCTKFDSWWDEAHIPSSNPPPPLLAIWASYSDSAYPHFSPWRRHWMRSLRCDPMRSDAVISHTHRAGSYKMRSGIMLKWCRSPCDWLYLSPEGQLLCFYVQSRPPSYRPDGHHDTRLVLLLSCLLAFGFRISRSGAGGYQLVTTRSYGNTLFLQ